MYSLPQASLIAQLSKQVYTRTVVARNEKHQICIGCRQFWYKIWEQRRCTASHRLSHSFLQDHGRQRWKTIHWTDSDWDYKNQDLQVSMPGYVEKALAIFKHSLPAKPQHQPHPHQPIDYGAKTQHSQPDDTLPLLSKAEKRLFKKAKWQGYSCIMHMQLIAQCLWCSARLQQNKVPQHTRLQTPAELRSV
jgi:hypothetical protein